ncbi:phosphatase PAP2 family protein [Nocardioides sp.]|uniref:phosphatase PAP2 family protein n=1 Tax=Nocardioides sp. TaxID=35761 RepID=UPI002ED99F5C
MASEAMSGREALRLTSWVWALAALFASIALLRSEHLGIPLRDPGGAMFRGRLTTAVVILVVLALADALVRGVRTAPLRWSLLEAVRHLRRRWTPQRLLLVGSGLLAYHVVYISYRNLKSWDALNTPRDDDLLSAERWLFLGHSPAVLLHDVLGHQEAAVVLAFIYRSFTYLVPLSVVGTLALLPRVREAYVMLCSALWVWILGLGSYYLIPTLGPFASAPEEFAGLRPTAITTTQAKYLAERAHFLADPHASDAFVSISAFASLHVGFTCTVLLVTRYYGWRRISNVLAAYLALVMVATVYFGWHFVVDDVAGVLLAVLAFTLGRLMVHPVGRGPDSAEEVAELDEDAVTSA